MEILARYFFQDFRSFLSSSPTLHSDIFEKLSKENETRLGQQTVSVE